MQLKCRNLNLMPVGGKELVLIKCKVGELILGVLYFRQKVSYLCNTHSLQIHNPEEIMLLIIKLFAALGIFLSLENEILKTDGPFFNWIKEFFLKDIFPFVPHLQEHVFIVVVFFKFFTLNLNLDRRERHLGIISTRRGLSIKRVQIVQVARLGALFEKLHRSKLFKRLTAFLLLL